MNGIEFPNCQASALSLAGTGVDIRPVMARYEEPHRSYHGLAHIEHMLEAINAMAALYGLDASELAIAHATVWYHDCVYVPGAKDNESRSATLADIELRKIWGGDTINQMYDAIMCTRDHQHPDTMLDAMIIDADLAGLGSTPEVYKKNSDKVKAEYPGITDEQWFEGRAAFLRAYLDRPVLYFTSWGGAFEDQARKNMEAELAYVTYKAEGVVPT